MVNRLVRDIQVIEKANRDFHPTPFSSMLVRGCLESGRDVTAGGAQYNSSGIQGVGVADVADSLAAIDEVVFRKRTHGLSEVIDAMLLDFKGGTGSGQSCVLPPSSAMIMSCRTGTLTGWRASSTTRLHGMKTPVEAPTFRASTHPAPMWPSADARAPCQAAGKPENPLRRASAAATGATGKARRHCSIRLPGWTPGSHPTAMP